MNTVNLKSIIELADESVELFERYKEVMGIELKPHELRTLKGLLSEMPSDVSFDGFYVNYCIPQLGKEMDLFRINKNGRLLNIELKSGNKTKDQMQNQLKKNRYYFIGAGFNDLVQYSYQLENNQLYRLDDEEIYPVNIDDLVSVLGKDYLEIDLDKRFSPKNYLISPFNQPKEFVEAKYILTAQQQQAQKDILKDDGMRHLIIGSAGTGKTLLVYSTAQKMVGEGKKVRIVHGGCLNNGHYYLNQHTSLSIKGIRDFKDFKEWLSDYDVIFLDEFQRFSIEQVQTLLDEYEGKIVFSGEPHQWLSSSEDGDELVETISNSENVQVHNLTHKIRTNKEWSQFIQYLFNTAYNGKYSSIATDKIGVDYFSNINDAKNQLLSLQQNGWKVLIPTGSLYNIEYYTALEGKFGFENAHNVIGQEFENVATIIGPNFKYNEEHKLISTGTYYPTKKSLFQNITRARNKLRLVIVDNVEVFNQATHILEKSLK